VGRDGFVLGIDLANEDRMDSDVMKMIRVQEQRWVSNV
jgi:hypothetical protein